MQVRVGYLSYVEDIIEIDDKYRRCADPKEEFNNETDSDLLDQMDEEIAQILGIMTNDIMEVVATENNTIIYEN